MMEIEEPRDVLKRLAREKGVTLAALSKVIGRNAAYIQQYVTRGSPARLDDEDRLALADFLGVDDRMLAKPVPRPQPVTLVEVSRLAVQASAGAGAIVADEHAVGRMGFDPLWLRRVTRASPAELSIIQVHGDSMEPTLADGDDVLVERSEASGQLRDGIYVLRRDDMLIVKRLAVAPTSATLTISSDNPAYPTWRDCPPDSVTIVGRAIWALRRLA